MASQDLSKNYSIDLNILLFLSSKISNDKHALSDLKHKRQVYDINMRHSNFKGYFYKSSKFSGKGNHPLTIPVQVKFTQCLS